MEPTTSTVIEAKQLQVLVRFLLTTIGGSLATHGVITADQWQGFQPYMQVASGGIISMISLAWSLYSHRRAAYLKAVAKIEQQEAAVAASEAAKRDAAK